MSFAGAQHLGFVAPVPRKQIGKCDYCGMRGSAHRCESCGAPMGGGEPQPAIANHNVGLITEWHQVQLNSGEIVWQRRIGNLVYRRSADGSAWRPMGVT